MKLVWKIFKNIFSSKSQSQGGKRAMEGEKKNLHFLYFFGPRGLSYVQIGPGIQNFKKILPVYVRKRVYATACYEQVYLAISLQQKEQCMLLNY